MKKYLQFIVLGIFITISSVGAQTDNWNPVKPVDENINYEFFQTFRDYVTVPFLSIVTPTIIQVDFDNAKVNDYFGVYSETSKQFVPYITTTSLKKSPYVSNIKDGTNQIISSIFDNNYSTKKDFYLNANGKNKIELWINYSELIKTDSLNLYLDSNVTLPDYITIRAQVNNTYVVVLNRYKPYSGVMKFPPTTSKDWIVDVEYSQPLRLTEVNFNNLSNEISRKSVKFLGLPNNTYKVYANQESYKSTFGNIEKANLYVESGVKKIGLLNLIPNSLFVPVDNDGDGIANSKDNCPNLANSDQKDINVNGLGDVCDDFDQDGMMNSIDNCVDTPNYNQKDTDGDKIGDLCDSDESRLTEKYPLIVWFGIGFAALIFLGLLFIAGNKIRKNNQGIDINNIPPQVPPMPPQI